MTSHRATERREQLPTHTCLLSVTHNFCYSIVKLVKNFRSHPDILHFPNQVFYGGDLRSHGHSDIINAYTNWPHLPRAKFPVIFHSVAGEDKREASSPSYFNIEEITQVKTYVKLLLADRRIPIGKYSIS